MEHKLADRITRWCMEHYEMTEGKAAAVTYGIELLFDTLFKVIGLLILGILFHRTWEVIVTLACFCSLRSQAGGVHMQTNLGCFSSMLAVCALACAGAEYIEALPLWLLAAVSIVILLLNKIYAPFFTENNPIEDERILRRKNHFSVGLSAILLGIVWVVPDWELKLLMLIPVLIESLSILPCWHGRKKTEVINE